MRNLKGKNAVVTGGSSGIGRALAIELAREGVNVIIAGTNEKRMEETVKQVLALGVHAAFKKTDVSKKEQVKALIDFAIEKLGSIDLLINNAGVGMMIELRDLSIEDDWEWLMNINLWGPIYGCHYVLPHMIERGSGQIVNVSSMSAFVHAAGSGAYASAKAAVLSMTQSLRVETAHLGIGVTAVCPGITKTPMLNQTKQKDSTDISMEKVSFAQDPQKTALQILKGIKKNKRLVLPSPDSKIAYHLSRLFPALFYRIELLSAKHLEKHRVDAK